MIITGFITNHKNKWLSSVCTELWVISLFRPSCLVTSSTSEDREEDRGAGGSFHDPSGRFQSHTFSQLHFVEPTSSFCDIVETCHSVPKIDGKNYKQLLLPSEIHQRFAFLNVPGVVILCMNINASSSSTLYISF